MSWLTFRVRLGIFIVLMVVAAALIYWGVTTHDEPGFRDGAPLWDRADFPLAVRGFKHTSELGPVPLRLEDDAGGTLGRAMAAINGRVGFRVFDQAGHAETPMVVVLVGAPSEPGWGDADGTAKVAHRGGLASRCEVETRNVPTQDVLLLVLQHELGHCLGLAHDPHTISIMFPELAPVPGEVAPWITDADLATLRARYAPR